MSFSRQSAPHNPQRLNWVDSARGCAILLVVFGHAWRGLFAAGLIENTALFRQVDAFIYLFHMPVFFILSGMFVTAISKPDLRTSICRQAWRLLYPLLVWTYVFLFARLVAGSAANAPLTLATIRWSPLPPVDHMWFLWALFLIQIVALTLIAAFPASRHAPLTAFLFFSYSVLLAVIMPLPDPLYPYLYNAITNAPYFLFGWVLATLRLPNVPPRGWVLPSLLAFGVLGALAGAGDQWPVLRAVQMGLMPPAFLVLVASLYRLFPNGGLPRILENLGILSLPIFLAHTIFSAAIRVALMKFGITDIGLHLGLGVLGGVLFPCALFWLAGKSRTRRLLGF